MEMPETLSNHTTILLDIYEKLGRIETQLQSIKTIESDARALEIRTRQLEGKLGSVLLVGGAIVGTAVFLLGQGFTFIFHKFWPT